MNCRRISIPLWVAATATVANAAPAGAATLQVGPGKTYAKPCDAIAKAQAGDTIEVDAGSYNGDTCAWSTDNLTIRGVNGRARIDLTGVTPVQKKGIFTISANNTTIESFELSGAVLSASDGNNGAGVRFQGQNLTLRNCFLHDNQDGILGAPATANTGVILIEKSEFAANGAGDGFSHNMYIGNFAEFTLKDSYSHAAKVGHLFKSRAYVTFVLYNRLTDESGATASYEVDIPNGGTAYVIGNVIEQSAASQNPAIITFGEEGTPAGYDTRLFIVNNTVLNYLGSGTFVVDTTPTPAVISNNIFWNGGKDTSQAAAVLTSNFDSAMGDPMFVDVANYDVHLRTGSPCIDKGTDPGKNGAQSLAPAWEYVHPLSETVRTVVGAAVDMGAYEFGLSADAGIIGAGGDASSDAPNVSGGGDGAGGDEGAGASAGADAGRSGGVGIAGDGGRSSAASGSSSGCGCAVAASPRGVAFALAGEGLLVLLAIGRRVTSRRR